MSLALSFIEEGIKFRKDWIAELHVNTKQHQEEIDSNDNFINQFQEEIVELESALKHWGPDNLADS